MKSVSDRRQQAIGSVDDELARDGGILSAVKLRKQITDQGIEGDVLTI